MKRTAEGSLMDLCSGVVWRCGVFRVEIELVPRVAAPLLVSYSMPLGGVHRPSHSIARELQQEMDDALGTHAKPNTVFVLSLLEIVVSVIGLASIRKDKSPATREGRHVSGRGGCASRGDPP